MENALSAIDDAVVVPSLPRKAFRVEIFCDGHDWEEVSAELHRLCDHVLEHGKECRLVCGNGWVTVTESPEQTKERFYEQLESYLAAKRSG